MARRCLFLSALSVVSFGFQLRVPLALQPNKQQQQLGAPKRANTVKSCQVARPTSTTGEGAAAPLVQARGGSRQEERFDWAKQWYPVLAVRCTDPGRAHAVQLLGKDLVVWKNSEGAWAAFEDRCPHRAAPLTEGRVEKDGSLLCAYHGWRFDSDGKCLTIPQSERGGRDEAQAAACPKVYRTQVAQDMIWVWGDNGPDAGLESALTPAAMAPELSDVEALESGRVVACSSYQRDLPYSWETFMENLMDPAHTVVSHHGLVGDRDMAAPLKIELRTPGISKDGFVIDTSPPFVGAGAVACAVQFGAPSLVVIDNILDDGSVMKLVQYGVPTRPGWCRILSRQLFIAAEGAKETQQKKIIRVPGGLKPQHLPDWVQHAFGHARFLNQDIVLLHHQEKILDSGGYNSLNYKEGVFTPTESDKGVLLMRKWMEKFAPDGPVWGEGCDTNMPPRERNTDELFDLYETHTKSCTSCLGALKRVDQLIATAKASAAASFAWAVLRGARAIGVSASSSASVVNVVTARAMLPGLAAMFASLGSIKVLNTIRKSFYTSDFNHQDNE